MDRARLASSKEYPNKLEKGAADKSTPKAHGGQSYDEVAL